MNEDIPTSAEHRVDNPSPKPKWKKATKEEKVNFNETLDDQLAVLNVPESVSLCQDVHCQDENHCNDADVFMTSILDAISDAAHNSLPVSNKSPNQCKRETSKPGWSQFVKPFRDNAFFWSQVWNSAGRPLHCQLHTIMKRTRNLYHFHVRKIKKSEAIIKKNNLLEACLNGNGEIFKEIKKIRHHKPPVATSMDGAKENISDHFKGIYKNLYNSANDMEEMNQIKEDVEANINHTELYEVNKVTTDIIKEAAKNLRDDKADPVYSFSSDCIKNGTERLFELLALAIQSFLIHGHISMFLLLSTLIPLIKDKLGSINSSKNYRSIAISSLVAKLSPIPSPAGLSQS